MSRLWILPILLSTSMSAAAQPQNLFLNRSYDFWQDTHPGAGLACTDEGDRVQLTDGYTNYKAGSIRHDKPTVGWDAEVNVPVVIWFDLEEPATLSELRDYTTGGGGDGAVEVGVRVLVSLDDKTYVPAGEWPVPDPGTPNHRTRSRPRKPSSPAAAGSTCEWGSRITCF